MSFWYVEDIAELVRSTDDRKLSLQTESGYFLFGSIL
jgi:hypothetical protein